MAVKKLEQFIYGVYRYVADTLEDAKTIPVDAKQANMGSEVYVIETGKTYILGGGSTWYSKVDGDTFDCECGDIMPESTIWENLPEVAAARKKKKKGVINAP